MAGRMPSNSDAQQQSRFSMPDFRVPESVLGNIGEYLHSDERVSPGDVQDDDTASAGHAADNEEALPPTDNTEAHEAGI